MAGIYIHIPFCEKKCFYCDFYSLGKSEPDDTFITAMEKEIELYFHTYPEAEGFKANSLFFGGGTPSLLSARQLRRIVDALKNHINFDADFEFTLEANPGSSDSDKFREFRSIGANRLSVGVQSFIPSELNFLQRIHTPEEAEHAIFKARDAGFDNVNLDLIFAVPGQTKDTFLYNLQKAASLGTDHISVYSLMYEEGTPLFELWKKGTIKKTNEEADAELFEMAQAFLFNNGFEQYEISNYAKPGKRCRHNLNYWHGEEYLAFGPSAHGHFNKKRYRNFRSLNKYYENLDSGTLPLESSDIVSSYERLEELIFLGLRADGITFHKIYQETGIDIKAFLLPLLVFYKDNGLINLSFSAASLTSRGYILCDEITLKIIEEVEKKVKI